MTTEAAQRRRVVESAYSWLRTEYHHAARVKGVGVDCLTLLVACYEEAGLIPPLQLPYYSKEWHLHHGAELYLNGLLRFAGEIDGPPLPGDIVLWKIGRCFSHAALVVDWPTVIHAYAGRHCTLENAEADWLQTIGENAAQRGQERPRRFFSYWRK